jgi:hypothetical protein
LDGIDVVMPWARTAPVPAMWSSAVCRLLLAVVLPATMALIAVSRVATWPCRSAATAALGSLVAPDVNALNWVM